VARSRNNVEYPMCVRHAKPRKDVRLRHFFLCDGCSDQWSTEAFNGHMPLYLGEPVHGYCLLCNRLQKGVRLRTWFLCDICHRVAGSIGRNHVAEQAILDFWEKSVKPRFPSLRLMQNDPSSLRPRRDTDQSGIAPVDFLTLDEKTRKNVFGIENKTGRSSVREMSQFQLDVSDCDCILNEMRSLKVPIYLIHAQVLEVWLPPTMGYRTVGLWWSDVYTMAAHFKDVRMRRDESRGAAYFGKKAFSDIATLPDHLWGKRGFALVERFRREGVPVMYSPG
jgi:hypothetical protein